MRLALDTNRYADAVLRRFLLKPGVGVLYADEQTTHNYAAVHRHSLILFARDAHFDALAQLARVSARQSHLPKTSIRLVTFDHPSRRALPT